MFIKRKFFQGQILVKQQFRSVRKKITISTKRVWSIECPLVRDSSIRSTNFHFFEVLAFVLCTPTCNIVGFFKTVLFKTILKTIHDDKRIFCRTVSYQKSEQFTFSGMSFPVHLIIYCCCKEKIDSYLVYCSLLAGHVMGDPFEISTIRREVSMFVLLMYLEVRMRFSLNFVYKFLWWKVTTVAESIPPLVWKVTLFRK